MTGPSAVQTSSGDAPISRIIARQSGADTTRFNYLYKLAERESSLNPEARATTSSAYGLFQFIDQTWLNLIEQFQDELSDPDGTLNITEPVSAKNEDAILALRADPELSVKMAAKLTEQNENILAKTLGREPTSAELYFAHFMGPSNAAKLIKAPDSENAVNHFPAAASANHAIFFDGDLPRTVAEVRSILADGFDSSHSTASRISGPVEQSSFRERSFNAPVAAASPRSALSTIEILIFSQMLEFNDNKNSEKNQRL